MVAAQAKRAMALAMVGLMALAAGCSSYQPAPDAFHKAVIQPYRLDAGDSLRIIVFEQADLTNTYAVDQSGFVSFPLIGSVNARGRTVWELEDDITGRLRQGFLRDPDVSIQVDRHRAFFILGEVNAAGQYAYVPGMNVQNAIAIAGGYTPRADQSRVDITRKVDGEVMTGRVTISDPILAGDTIYVLDRHSD